jgi:hypothetical protein
MPTAIVVAFDLGNTWATTYSISGNAGAPFTTISYSGAASGSVTSDSSGNFTIPGLVNGSYTIIPSNTGYIFSPTSQNKTISGSSIVGVNFTATNIGGGPGTGIPPFGWVNIQGDHYNKHGLDN